ncbi:uncharacterized protein LOC131175392 [Hevea brasiliensis]|uniref:uncharacterized protein LOC131175392 n=1 Tax=Hevea brasiliensis TaxID=3981 RepID=UPI0025E22BA1|nr:uncharacterized protein LOC131175392 [Hevea brasiliensis]XP_057995534.1 uncharacterized protein LOC131175392 [Hevea brasiliensis]XP_057995538.1 uncharacterized protein LOC131175392 [Hevea brasiliensis]XP_057995541.1 uncharacterized protein LOC131175392 [Hevea brasiliensis]XP_057995543.1 uncharacterized protein LOC131175392 [Hevea brasiliensis]XP_057995545.1 uncharacterized protein LOC131175392 [Hevea brasiliensis]XP_057995548.1 uncharacterized protein LOC131175392 [Hevea brasiliensis]XP_0
MRYGSGGNESIKWNFHSEIKGCDEPVIVRFADPIKREIMHLVDKIFGPCFHEPMIRPTPNFRDSMGGTITASSKAATNTVFFFFFFFDKQPPTQLCQMTSQQTQVPQKFLQSSQQAVSDMLKEAQNLEQQQSVQITPEDLHHVQIKSETSPFDPTLV